jgi:hypothetical protein
MLAGGAVARAQPAEPPAPPAPADRAPVPAEAPAATPTESAAEPPVEGPPPAPPPPAPETSPPDAVPAVSTIPSPAAATRFVMREDTPNPLRESVLVFEQSITTQTAGVGQTPQSYVPLYELWASFRPRYHFDDHWSVRARFDYTKEVTNAEQTTDRNEDVFGDIWTDVVYETRLDRWWRDTKVELGLRAIWPTSKISQGNGQYLSAGPRAAASHAFQLRGPDARWLNDLYARVSLGYLYDFSAATTPNGYGNFGYVRQNLEDRSFESDVISGQTLTQHELGVSVLSRLQISPRLSFTADVYVLGQWHYAPTGNVNVGISGGPTAVPPPANDNQFTEYTWVTAEVAYDIVREVTVSLGYYNLANAVAPDGQGRSVFGSDNIWWSPGARFFFDITANLDSLFDDARGHAYTSAANANSAHAQRVANHTR